ncbi:hypothetical protein D3C76_623640 [compost metagenome]
MPRGLNSNGPVRLTSDKAPVSQPITPSIRCFLMCLKKLPRPSPTAPNSFLMKPTGSSRIDIIALPARSKKSNTGLESTPAISQAPSMAALSASAKSPWSTAPATRTAVFSAVWKVERILSRAAARASASFVMPSMAASATVFTPSMAASVTESMPSLMRLARPGKVSFR